MPDTFVRTRCNTCEKVLTFDDWSGGGKKCQACERSAAPSVTPQYVRGPRRTTGHPEPVEEDYDRLLDAIPDELIDELVAALEAEAARLPAKQAGPVQEVFDEIGYGRSPKERQWAAWGFAAGFAANVLVAKYAQMASNAPMGQFVGPLMVGGLVAGLACAAIGWGLARLREPQVA